MTQTLSEARAHLASLGAQYIYTIEGGWRHAQFGITTGCVYLGLARKLGAGGAGGAAGRLGIRAISHGKMLRYSVCYNDSAFSTARRLVPVEGSYAHGTSYTTCHLYTKNYVLKVTREHPGHVCAVFSLDIDHEHRQLNAYSYR
jgi:hypothetical protein